MALGDCLPHPSLLKKPRTQVASASWRKGPGRDSVSHGWSQKCPGAGGGLARASQWTDQKRKKKVDIGKGRRDRKLLISTGRQAYSSDKEEGTHTLQTE